MRVRRSCSILELVSVLALRNSDHWLSSAIWEEEKEEGRSKPKLFKHNTQQFGQSLYNSQVGAWDGVLEVERCRECERVAFVCLFIRARSDNTCRSPTPHRQPPQQHHTMQLFTVLSFALAATLAAGAATDHWAVIVAGSNTYANYRHQADACHAYQVIPSPTNPEQPTLRHLELYARPPTVLTLRCLTPTILPDRSQERHPG